MRKNIAQSLFISFLLVSLPGCGKFIGNLRRDINETDAYEYDVEPPADPTVGGSWTERKYLSDSDSGEAEGSMGPRSSRRPASNDIGQQTPRLGRYPQNVNADRPLEDRDGIISSGNYPNYEPGRKRQYQGGSRARRDDFVDLSQEEGSLWASSGQTNYYFTKNRVRSPGDIISLNIEPEIFKDIGMEIRRTLSPYEKAKEVELIQNQIRSKFIAELANRKKDSISTSAAAPQKTENQKNEGETEKQTSTTSPPSASPPPLSISEELEKFVPRASLADVDIFPSIELKAGDFMMGEILERYPNGNFKVRVVKRVAYNKGDPRLVSVVGIVRGSDINDEKDVINSGKLYEYRIEVSH